MSGMIVHGIPGSPYVRAALLALEEKGAEYELAAMQFGTLNQQPHLSRLTAGCCTRHRRSCDTSTRSSPARGCSRKSRARRHG